MPGGRLRHLLRRRDPLLPPVVPQGRRPHEFRSDGDELLLTLAAADAISPNDAILDIGCGDGLLARPLTEFLVPGGTYLGIDVSPDPIEWCARAYAEYEYFSFAHADVANAFYRPAGSVPASEFSFPAEDGSVDVVALGTVFAHLVTAEAVHYLREAARVLRPGGMVIVGAYLLDLASRAAIARGLATPAFDLTAEAGPMVVVDPDLPEEAVAFEHTWFEQVTVECGFKQVAATPGSWRGGLARFDRDLIVLEWAP